MSDKRTHKVLLNFDEATAQKIDELATITRRTKSELLYLIISDNITEILNEVKKIKNAVKVDTKTGVWEINI